MSLVDKVKEKWAEIRAQHSMGAGLRTFGSLDEFIAQLDTLLPEEQKKNTQANNLRGFMSAIYHQNIKYKDAKDELLRLDLKERIRFLGFRIATAIGIAAVILATGAIAKCLEIPLPLLRIAT